MEPKTGAIIKLTSAEKWFRDGLQECSLAGCLESLQVDVTKSADLLKRFNTEGTHVKWAAFFVKAVAECLRTNPDLHQLVAGNRRLRPDQIDICLSVSSGQPVTPVIVIDNCAQRHLFSIATEIGRLTPLAQEADRHMIALLNRWGFLGFTKSFRQALLRFVLNRCWYRRKVSGTFQVSILPGVDSFAPFRFNTAGALGIGSVKQRPIVVDGQIVVRPTVTLTCCFDHTVWNGADASRFLNGVSTVLEQADFSAKHELDSQLDLPPSLFPLPAESVLS